MRRSFPPHARCRRRRDVTPFAASGTPGERPGRKEAQHGCAKGIGRHSELPHEATDSYLVWHEVGPWNG